MSVEALVADMVRIDHSMSTPWARRCASRADRSSVSRSRVRQPSRSWSSKGFGRRQAY